MNTVIHKASPHCDLVMRLYLILAYLSSIKWEAVETELQHEAKRVFRGNMRPKSMVSDRRSEFLAESLVEFRWEFDGPGETVLRNVESFMALPRAEPR